MIDLNRSLKLSAALVGAVALSQVPAHASRSSFSPNTSSDFRVSYSLQRDLPIKSDSGKPMTLTQGGYLLADGENVASLSPNDLALRKIDRIEIGYDSDSKKSFVGFLPAAAHTSFGVGAREAKFGLPIQVAIDGNGRPQGIENVNATAQDTGQGVALQLVLSRPGSWEHYSYNTVNSCTITIQHTICEHDHGWDRGRFQEQRGHHGDDHDDHCYVDYVSIPGHQHVHTEGDRKTDGYSVTIESAGQFGFDLDYDESTSSSGPCIAD